MIVAVIFGDLFGFAPACRPWLRFLGRGSLAGHATSPRPVDPSDARSSPPRIVGDSAPPQPEDMLSELDPDERNNIRVYNAANKGVVNITTETAVLGFFGDETSTGTGSGFCHRQARSYSDQFSCCS